MDDDTWLGGEVAYARQGLWTGHMYGHIGMDLGYCEEKAFQEERKVEEEVSEEEVELKGSDEEWLDWRVVVEEQEAKGSSGTETLQAEDKDKTTSEGNQRQLQRKFRVSRRE